MPFDAEAAKRKWCEQCGRAVVAYPGARFCGAGCTARREGHDPRQDQALALEEAAAAQARWETLRTFVETAAEGGWDQTPVRRILAEMARLSQEERT